MANQSEETKIAVISTNIEYIKGDIGFIKQSIKELSGVYATKEELRDVQEKTDRLEKQSNIMKIVSPAVASIITATVLWLLIFYLQAAK